MTLKRALWALVPCLAGLLGCDLEDLGVARYSKDFHYTYPLQSGGKLSLETFNGSVEITGWDRDMVEIDGAKYGPSPEAADALRIDISDTPTAIEIQVNRPSDFRGNRGARFSVKMPRKAVLDRVVSSNGSIVVEGATGPTSLHTSNGSIRVENFDDNVDARTSNGQIELIDVGGEAIVSTSNGRIRVDDLKGSLDAHTSNSSIIASVAGAHPSRSLRLETSNGAVDLTLPVGFDRSVRANTSNAPITLRMPDGINAHVFARTNNSSISSDFEMRVQGVVNKNNLDAAMGTGGPLLDLSTTNGPIRLRRL
jgi:hypothetical protein